MPNHKNIDVNIKNLLTKLVTDMPQISKKIDECWKYWNEQATKYGVNIGMNK